MMAGPKPPTPATRPASQKSSLTFTKRGNSTKNPTLDFYSVRQEQFLTDKERGEDGNFGSEWGEVVELEEENWYFKLSEHTTWLREAVESDTLGITPAFRKNEVLNAIEKAESTDLCISRPKERLSWGIPLPFDEDFVTYVWFDALINYISFAGYLKEDGSELPDFDTLWPAHFHVIGKDIMVPAHAVYWPCMLHAMGFQQRTNAEPTGSRLVERQKESMPKPEKPVPKKCPNPWATSSTRWNS